MAVLNLHSNKLRLKVERENKQNSCMPDLHSNKLRLKEKRLI